MAQANQPDSVARMKREVITFWAFGGCLLAVCVALGIHALLTY